MAQRELNLRDYWRIIRRHKFILILFPVLLGVTSFFFAEMHKPIPYYQTMATIKYEELTPVSELFFDRRSRAPYKSLAMQAMTVTSLPVLTRVAKKMGEIDESVSMEMIQGDQELMEAIFSLGDSVRTVPLEEDDINIIEIYTTSYDQLEAQQMANHLAECTREENIYQNNRQARESREFIEKQMKATGLQLKEAEDELKKYREKYKLFAIDTQIDNDLKRVGTLEENLVQVLVEKADTISLLDKFRQQQEGDKIGRIFFSDTFSSLQDLDKNLSRFELEIKDLLVVYTRDHPQVRQVMAKMMNVRTKMESTLKGQLENIEAREKNLLAEIAKYKASTNMIPSQAVELARLEREVDLNEDMFSMLQTKYQEALIEESNAVSEISVVRLASFPSVPMNSVNIGQKVMLGVAIGLILGFVLAFVQETFDTSISTIEDIESYLDVPVLGMIPHISKEEIHSRFLKHLSEDIIDSDLLVRMVTHFGSQSTAAESYRTLRTHLLSLNDSTGKKIFLVTSCSTSEGKSSTTTNLAITLAQSGLKTLLIEADLRKPTLQRNFGLEESAGLSDYLVGAVDWDEVVSDVIDLLIGELNFENIVMTPGLDNLYLVQCGKIPLNPSELLNSPRMNELLNMVRERYDIVIFDTPPVLVVTDATVLASQVDGILLIYDAGSKVPRRALKRAKFNLENVQGVVEGVVLNGIREEMHQDADIYKLTYRDYYAYTHDGEEPEPEPVKPWEQPLVYCKQMVEKGSEFIRKNL